MNLIGFSFLFIILVCDISTGLNIFEYKRYHSPKIFANNEIGNIASLSNETYFRNALDKILVPRVVGSKGHKDVREFIKSELNRMNWIVEEDKFTASPPGFSELEFFNIIARLNPNATRYMVLSCHYDSKYMKNAFLGATDSAVPCAMILEIVHSLQNELSLLKNSDLGLMLIFFDGEEAFVEWSKEDSLYGSRHLAGKWGSMPFPHSRSTTSFLASIDVLVLLDLIGEKDAKFYSFFKDSQRWHQLLAQTERKLKAMGKIPAHQPLHFLEKSTYSSVEDDHIPFLEKGVPILHVIPIPFPKVWHTSMDDFSALDFPTIYTISKIFKIFVLSYLGGSVPGWVLSS